MKIVKVKFLSTLQHAKANSYDFFLNDGVEADIGDILLVDSTPGYSLAQVVSIHDSETSHHQATRYAMDNLTDASDHLKALRNQVRQKEIRAEIKSRMKQVDETQKMKMYAEQDPRIKALLEELESNEK